MIRTLHGKRLAEATGAELMADGVQIPKRAAAAANVLLVELTDTPAPLRH